jgi:hypothetical protein
MQHASQPITPDHPKPRKPVRRLRLPPCVAAIVILGITACRLVPAGAQSGFSMPEGRSRVDVPFDFSGNFVLVNARFNRIMPLNFIFDTGAEHTILTRREISDFFKLSYGHQFKQVQGADLSDTLVAYLVRNVYLDIGDHLRATNQDILVLEEDYFRFESYIGVPVYGILAASTMSAYLIELDYRKQLLRMHKRSAFKPERHGFQPVPITFHRDKPYIEARVSVVPDSVVSVNLLLDTGAALPLLLYHNTHPLLSPPEQTIPSQIGMGLGGFLEGYTGRVAEVVVGPFTQRAVIAYFQEIDTSRTDINQHMRNGTLGNLFLQHFTVLFDYVGQTLWLKPIPGYQKPYPFDKSGLFIMATGDVGEGLLVQFVAPGSPAAQAGIRKGDRLLKAGGLKGVASNLHHIGKLLQKKAGKQVDLLLSRDDVEFQATIILRELI